MIEPAVALRATGLRAAGASDAGRVRRNNEDRFYFDLERGIFLVVDGVGGHAAGEVAASIAVDVIVDRLERGGAPPAAMMRQAIACANNEIHSQARRSVQHFGMTCVVTAALVSDDRLTIGHVGDSRLYKVTPDGLWKLTRDHSPVGEQEDAFEISEVDAMRHPRRNEVFRDIGSAPRKADDPEFVDTVETRFEHDSALLLCTDGLSDMLPSTSIERIIRSYAGDPQRVVDELIGAANDAGGRDNVTAVYVEGRAFSGAVPAAARSDQPSSGQTRPAGVPRRRILWLGIGAVLGGALGLATTASVDRVVTMSRGRVLVAGGAGAFPSITAAMTAASPRDVVLVEPGEYAEAVVLKEGVDLLARVPGSVVLVAPTGVENWTSLAASGAGGRIHGVHVLGRPDAPIATGVRLDGRDLVLDDSGFEGNIDVAVDVAHDGDIVVRANRFSDVKGLPLRIGRSARPAVRQNIFTRGTEEHGPAVHVLEDAMPTLDDNLFVGYTEPIGAPPARRQQLLPGNFVTRGQERVGR
jgi:serine/threonine protein phosphatase PrpC